MVPAAGGDAVRQLFILVLQPRGDYKLAISEQNEPPTPHCMLPGAECQKKRLTDVKARMQTAVMIRVEVTQKVRLDVRIEKVEAINDEWCALQTRSV